MLLHLPPQDPPAFQDRHRTGLGESVTGTWEPARMGQPVSGVCVPAKCRAQCPTLGRCNERDRHKCTRLKLMIWGSSVQSLSSVCLFATPWTATRQASLSITKSRSLLKLMYIELVMPSNHLILCRPLLLPQSFPAAGSFPMSQFFASGGQSTGVSALASVLPVNI